MSETYVEHLVKAKASPIYLVGKLALIGLSAISIFMALFMGLGIIGLLLAAVFGVLAYFCYLQADVEYEYLYLDKELTIDKVMAKTKRKRVATYKLEKMEILAPIRSYHLDQYKNRQVKTLDYSVGEECQPDLRYVFYYEGNTKIIINPSEAMVKAMRNVAPRKVFND